MLEDSKNWVSEVYDATGSAFSLKYEKHLHHEKSEYQKIDIYATTDFGNVMLLDDCMMLSDRDNFIYHEMIVHPAMFTHPGVKDAVIIGGGDCGTLKEVLRHDTLNSVVQAELDERVTRISEQYFPDLCSSNNDPRATLFFGDGLEWVKQGEPESVDLIIIDSTDPVGAAEGLFNVPFYQDCLRLLRPGGLIVQQSESPLLHLDLMASIRSRLLEAGFRSTQAVLFPLAVYPSGWWSATMARKQADIPGFRERGALNKNFPTRYYNAEIHKSSLALPEFMISRFSD
ncbi:MAG: polyamine aminopropyltransferase [bacterium]